MYKNKVSQAVLLGMAMAATAFPSFAANVPDGVKLAEKQELVRGNGTEVESLDPQKVSGVPESNVIRDLLEGLVNQDGDGNLIGGVAKSWESEDNKTWIFHLREDAKWSNGDPVLASDFVYTWRRLADPKTGSPYASYLEMTTMKNAGDIILGKQSPEKLGVVAVDDHTLKVELEKPLPYFVAMTVHTSMKPVNQKVVEKYGDKWTSPDTYVGNGAFQLDKWVVNERIVLKPNTHYWDNEKTVLTQVSFLPIENQVAAMNRFLAGEIDMTYEMPNEHFKRLVKQHAESVKVTPYLCSYYYEFNTAKAPFNDERVRQALSYAIDRDVIAKFIVGKGETPAYNFTPLATNGLDVEMPDYAKLSQKERVAKAQALLEAAGYGKDKPLQFDLLYNTSENHKKIAVAIASMWKKSLGVTATLENQEWKSYLDSKRQGNFDVSRAGWCGDYNEASTFLGIMRDGHSQNYPKYANKQFDGQLDKALLAHTPAERAQAYKASEALLAKDMPIMPIYHYVNARLVNPKLGGYPVNNPEDNIFSKDLYIIAD
ncbi:ABC transporter substrate-binding protein [Photobacterium aphoticum]|uniref:Peptide ABC transporter substrate-binding protein n=1 Tax=Photobacterium aphoticum TaxID=754436 RepID=A0A0J1GMZ2_9GAMM|nr:ABC transporter substrate-binding protein [Photobacterium aphoticum]KLV01123.1 peptide ABC transporter substrate-binding protein [Photobacterium aphoticum]PSU57664.1 oligopeptide ABC transporter substrate-binding protein OppA [Photobacterium aphoticum]GHA37956.1 peptide ABC transporter substrate-binding protein [Photobacterium aphoticum]